MTSYSDTLRDLFNRTADGIKLGLDSTRALLKAVGNPQEGLTRMVLVAGTNGKGSTSALLARALETTDEPVGFFSSPHLLRFADRIRIGAETIPEEEVLTLYDEIRAVEHLCPTRPTFFECTTVMATLFFSRRGIRTAVFEVGLGGRLDATNTLPRILSVITPIGLDHEKFLGGTVALIAAEKAAIIEPGGRAVMSAQVPGAGAVIEQYAQRVGARLLHAPQGRLLDTELTLTGGSLVSSVTLSPWTLPAYQQTNVATAAIACQELHNLGVLKTPEAIHTAVARFDWPGRYQWIAHAPPLLVDGAHNTHAIHALLAALECDPRLTGKRIHGVFTALRDKSADEMVALLRPHLHSMHLTPVTSRRSRNTSELADLDPSATVYPSIDEALAGACAVARPEDVVLVTGSLYLVGAAIAWATGAPKDPSVDG